MMRRDLIFVSSAVGLLCALLLGASWALLAVPPVPADLLPADAVLVRAQAQGRQQLVSAQLGPRQSLHDLYRHLRERGWNLRRANIGQEDEDQIYFRRSLSGHLLEIAIVTRAGTHRGAVLISYDRCVRRLTCSWP